MAYVYLLAFLLWQLISCTIVIPKQYPLFKQCDDYWGADLMGGDDECNACGKKASSVCREGCAMSAVAMALNGKNVLINGDKATPGTLNAYLHNNGGYLCLGGDCNNLKLDAPNALSQPNYSITFISENQKPSYPTLQGYIMSTDLVSIGHVLNNTHFVLLIGWDTTQPNTFLVNDPAYNTTTYNYGDISDVLLYVMAPKDVQSVEYKPVTSNDPPVCQGHDLELSVHYSSVPLWT